MDSFYVLQHENPDGGDAKLIGLYSSHASAEAAIKRLQAQPGFCEHPDCFAIDTYELDKDHWAEGFVRV